MAVPTERLASSDGPLLEVVTLGPLSVEPKVFSAIALFALVNGALINLIMASRLVYGMARERVVPAALGRVLPGRQTPWAGIAFTATLAAVLVLLGDLETLADTTVLLLLAVFVAVHVSVLRLRGDRVDHEHFRAPTALPVLGIVTCAALWIYSVVQDPKLLLWVLGLLAVGLALWLVTRAVTGHSAGSG
jgi:APA family basic amino acid/polyamine antiporter